jgi:hypothetical protein
VIITGLRFTNYGPFRGEHELELGPGAYSIVGEHEGDPHRSNWSGKSTFLGAIRFALRGEHSWPTEDAWITEGEKEGGVDVEIEGGAFASRTRVRGDSTQLRVVLPVVGGGERELRGDEAQRALDIILGTSSDEDACTWWSAQKDVDFFLKADPAVITRQVVAWVGLDKVRAAAAIVSEELRDLLKKQEALRLSTATARQQIDRVLAGRDVAKLQDRLAEVAGTIVSLKRSISAQRDQLAEKERRARLRADAARHDGLVREIQTLEAELAAVPSIYEDCIVITDEELAEAQGKVAKLQQLVSERRLLARGQFDGTCPVGGIRCPVTSDLNARATENVARHEEATQALQEATGEARRIAQVRRAKEDRKKRIEAITWQLQAKRQQASEFAPAAKTYRELPPFDDGFRDLSKDLELAEAARDKLASEVQTVGTQLELAADYEDQAKKLEPDVIARREALLILGPAGAQRRVAEGMLGEIERGANDLLAESGIDLSVAFQWARPTQQPAEHCAQCGSPFPATRTVKACVTCGAQRGPKLEHKFRAVAFPRSGGAEDLVGLAVRLAAAAWLRRARGSSWAIACLDEPFGALDLHNRHAVARHLASMLGARYGVEQAFVTAHDAGLLAAFPHRIKIVAGPNGSRPEVIG